MIPKEVADIASLIDPGWTDGTDEDMQFTLEAAWRIYNAGYRLRVIE